MTAGGGRIVDYGGPNPDDLAVPLTLPPELAVPVSTPPAAQPTNLAVPVTTSAPVDNFAVPLDAASRNDLAVPGMTGGSTPAAAPQAPSYATPELMPAGGQYATPYYAAYTNDGDFAGAVMVNPDQKVRLVDPRSGDVIFEGAGPDAARMATQIANGVSQEKGRKAAWAIQKDDGGDWQTMAAERYDPKKTGLLGSLADIALPILGAVLMPVTGGMSMALAAGLGAAGGSALSSLAQGRSLSDTLIRAAASGVGAGVGAGAFGGAAGGAGSSGAAGAAGATGSGAGSAAGSAAGFTAAELAGAVAPITVTAGAGSALGSAIGAGLGSGLGSGASGALQSGGGSNTLRGDPGADQVGTTVDEVTVTANRLAQQGLSADQLVAMGIPAAVATAAVWNFTNATGVEGVDVSPDQPNTQLPIDPPIELPAVVPVTPNVGGLTTPPDVVNPDPDIQQNVPGLVPTNVGGTPTSSNPATGALDWLKNNPALVAALLSALGGAAGGGDKKYTVPVTSAGTRGSLGSIFSAQLPASNLAVRSQRDMSGTDWQHYGMGPERSFFTNVPKNVAEMSDPARFAVQRPRQPMTAADQDELTVPQFARGGSADFAVRGAGDGRSDSIPAALSDGEYVIDAETVALLGNGSSEAGAKKLDRFRVNVRKHKGRSLAQGRFSVPAREPEAYLAGGRS